MSSAATSGAGSATSSAAGVTSSQSAAASTTVVSQPTTVTIPPTTTIPGTTITTSVPSTSIVSAPPSTTVVVNTPVQPTTVITQVTSVVTQPAAGTSPGGYVTTIISTQSTVTITPSSASTSTRTSANASSTQSALSATGSSGATNGLSSAATIAIAVIIPIVAVIGLVILGLWLWRRRKAKKNDEELRKNEMAEYGFNPNHDPTLPVAGAAYTDGGSEGNDDSGYRGWGATTSNRKTSTTLGSQSRGLGGMNGGMSDHGGSQGYAPQPSPSAGGSDVMSQDPLVHGYPDAATTGAVGAAALAGGAGALTATRSHRYSQVSAPSGIHRGPSNASSAYSGVARSEASSDVPDMPRPYYEQEIPYNVYNDIQPGHASYGDSAYPQSEEPVIRDVSARRNTRIERAPTFPQQGGIAQNF